MNHNEMINLIKTKFPDKIPIDISNYSCEKIINSKNYKKNSLKTK